MCACIGTLAPNTRKKTNSHKKRVSVELERNLVKSAVLTGMLILFLCRLQVQKRAKGMGLPTYIVRDAVMKVVDITKVRACKHMRTLLDTAPIFLKGCKHQK